MERGSGIIDSHHAVKNLASNLDIQFVPYFRSHVPDPENPPIRFNQLKCMLMQVHANINRLNQ